VLRGFCPLLSILSGGGATEPPPPPPPPDPEPTDCATVADLIAARDYIVANMPTGVATTTQLNAAKTEILTALAAAKAEILAAIADIPSAGAGYARVNGVQYAKLADAAAAVPLNGVVEVYGELRDLNATAAFTRSCTIRGMTPDAKLNWTLGTTQPMAFSKGLVVCEVAGGAFLVENLELCGARTPDSTGAGVRGSTGTAELTVRNCNIHDCENGVLATSTVQFYYDNTFLNNGNAAGSAHGIYVNSSSVNEVTAERNSFGTAIVGHHFKCRAKKLTFRQNMVAELNGACSRQMDISNGGDCLIEFNVFEQGPNALNNAFIGYAPEGLPADGRVNQFVFRDNILINDFTSAIGVRLYNPVTFEEVVRNSFVAVSTPAVNLTLDATNSIYADRAAAGYAAYPFLPEVPGP
jgi:hypothetical protein